MNKVNVFLSVIAAHLGKNQRKDLRFLIERTQDVGKYLVFLSPGLFFLPI